MLLKAMDGEREREVKSRITKRTENSRQLGCKEREKGSQETRKERKGSIVRGKE
jgi:hypothetical protein